MGIEAVVDDIYSKNFCGSYEGIAYQNFLAAMRKYFGKDETKDAEKRSAFEYARSEYGYEDEGQEVVSREVDRAHGICCHGLEFDDCPAGCAAALDFK